MEGPQRIDQRSPEGWPSASLQRVLRLARARWHEQRRRNWSFAQLLKWHLESGTRPGTSCSERPAPWAIKEFAFAVKHPSDKSLPDRSVRNWLNGESIPGPDYFANIEIALFGSDPHRGRLRTELRRAYERKSPPQEPDRGWRRFIRRYSRLTDKKKGIAQASSLIISVQVVILAAYFVHLHAKHTTFQIERDLSGFDGLDALLRGARFIEFDCGMRALESGGMEKFKIQQAEMRRFSNALIFRERVVHPFLVLIMNAIRQGQSVESLKDRARAVAGRFSPLTNLDLPESRFIELYGKARSELNAQIAALRGMGVSDAWPSAEEQATEAADPTPVWCQDETQHDLEPGDVRDLLKNGRVVYRFAVGLYRFAGDIEMAVTLGRQAKMRRASDININADLGELLSLQRKPGAHLSVRELDEASELLDISLNEVKTEAAKVESFQGTNPADLDIQEKLRIRYRRAGLVVERTIAFLWAQESVEHRVPWHLANQYAEDNFRALINGRLQAFPCVDDFMKVAIFDIYGYVKLMFQRYRQSIGDSLEDREIVDAITHFDEALALLRQVKSNVCIWQQRRKELWEDRISAHVHQAQEMLK